MTAFYAVSQTCLKAVHYIVCVFVINNMLLFQLDECWSKDYNKSRSYRTLCVWKSTCFYTVLWAKSIVWCTFQPFTDTKL